MALLLYLYVSTTLEWATSLVLQTLEKAELTEGRLTLGALLRVRSKDA